MVNNLLIAISHDKYLTYLVFSVSNISYRTLLFFPARIYDHLCAWAIKSSRKTRFVAWFADLYPK